MEHTKKFVLMDPRFVRPSMRDKVLSGLDSEISNILESNESDEIKARSYIASLARFINYSKPPAEKLETKTLPTAPPTVSPLPALPVPRANTSRKRIKRAKVKTLDSDPNITSVSWDRFVQPDSTHDTSLWKRSPRTRAEKKKKSSWVVNDEALKKKKKSRKTWVQI